MWGTRRGTEGNDDIGWLRKEARSAVREVPIRMVQGVVLAVAGVIIF